MSKSPFVIMLTGAPAGGKSTIAREFQDLYQANSEQPLYWLATDQIRRAVAHMDFRESLKQAVYDGMLAMAERLHLDGFDLLLDANFVHAGRREKFLQIGQPHQTPMTVLVRCELETRETRNQLRSPEDQVSSDYLREAHLAAEQFAPSADLVLDTESTPASECAARLLDRVRARTLP